MRILFAALACLILTPALHAQRAPRVLVGPEIGIGLARQFHDDYWAAAGYLRIPLVNVLDLRAGGDVETGGEHDTQLNLDLALHGARDLAWLGAGVAWVHRDFGAARETRTGTNLFIGFKPLPGRGPRLFAEGRWTLLSGETLFRTIFGVAWSF